MSRTGPLCAIVFGALLGAFSATNAGAQTTTGTVTGRITDASSGAPIVAAQVSIVGTTLGTQSNAEGTYVIRGIPAGSVELRALRVGYAEQKQSIAVTAGQSTTANLQMSPVAVALTPVVTTATGEQRSVEVANAISTVNASELVQNRPVTNMGDLLTARAPGVQVLPGTQTGTGARVRIRGSSSLSLSNDPIYIIDGVRMESSSGSSSIGVGGSLPSRVADINPEEIESIEVVKGPSAATLYGTDAANGVIVIKTKRGTAGAPRWNVYTEQTAITDRNDYPTAYRAWRTGPTPGTTSTPSNGAQCLLTQRAAGSCVQDSITTYNLFEDDVATPFTTGYRQQYGLQVSGGTETVRYFVHGEYEDETGVTRMPDFAVARLREANTPILSEWRRPNAITKYTARANLNLTLPNNAELAFNAGYITSDQRLPQSDNNTTGLLSNAFGGPGFRYNIVSGDTAYGYRTYTPDAIFQETVTQGIDRFLGSTNANWSPTDWLALRGNFGVDFTSRVDSDLCRFGQCSDFGTQRLGFKTDNRTTLYAYTVDVGATGTFDVTDRINSKTTVGVQFYRNLFDRNGANATNLPPGATSVTQGAVKDADESTVESRTLGAFIEEAVAINDRLFLTAAVRSDRNSAFGADFETVFYPKFGASWVLSQEPFFPVVDWLDQLRLRTAYGSSGVQPGTTDAVQYFAGTVGRFDDAEVPGVVFSALGNQGLKPERSTELEAGIDGVFLDNRLVAEVTFYNKTSKDALIERPLPGSAGTGLTSRFENLGEVRNWGWEWLVNAQLLSRDRFGWDVTVNGSHNSNELVDLGVDAAGEDVPPIIGSSISQFEGFPINGYWVRPILSYADADGNGILTAAEVQVGEELEFRGYSLPRTEISFTNGFDFLDRTVRLTTLLDYKGGHKLYNNTERIRCQSRNNCRGLIDPNASLAEQARVVALRELGTLSTVDGFIEDASFVRLREISLSFSAPESWAARMRASSLGLTLAARNLAVWTDYSGADPESNYEQDDVPSDFQTIAPPSYFTLRVNLGF
ncbi:MAG TPA: SusC/RagA family TonB-linked outer membrane protein [Gemmatimonadales bacterium]